MKKIIILTAGFIVLGFASNAQCDKKIKWTASKTEFINSSGNVDSRNESAEVTTSREKVSVIVEGAEEELNGDVTNYSCNWKDKNNGVISFKSQLTNKRGNILHATVTIETINSKTTILLQAEEKEKKIRLTIDSYEEVK